MATEYKTVKVKVNRTSRGTYWYSKLVGKTVEVRKGVNGDKTTYQYMEGDEAGNIAIFDNNDVEEVSE